MYRQSIANSPLPLDSCKKMKRNDKRVMAPLNQAVFLSLVRAKNEDDGGDSSFTRRIGHGVDPQMLIYDTNDQENPQEEEEFQLEWTEKEDEGFGSSSAIFAQQEETATLICLRQQLFTALQAKTCAHLVKDKSMLLFALCDY
eukprot:TRINITY_DN14369_c0_g1_i1.p1 TRINITY_DN14369_c0_g1~~TRINITY_DN14369_c0_g1_i1.p1  ORF type:complete len:143 (+),score=19.96 TRINITY_DN14369_c0_g1_i1:2-430(+)